MRRAFALTAVALALFCASGAGAVERNVKVLDRPGFTVLHEQRGAFEDQIKAGLTPALRARTAVERAYLVRIRYHKGDEEAVALLIQSPEDPALMEDLARSFRDLAGPGVSLDMIFIDGSKAGDVAAKHTPFYAR